MMLDKIKEKALEEHIPIIMDDTLEVIGKYLEKEKPKRILEIGTAVGYSAICFSKFLDKDGVIDTIERDEERIKEAKINIKNMNLEKVIKEPQKSNQNREKFKKKYIDFFIKYGYNEKEIIPQLEEWEKVISFQQYIIEKRIKSDGRIWD